MLVYVCSVATTGKLTRKFGKQCRHLAKGLIKVAAFNLDYGNGFPREDAGKATGSQTLLGTHCLAGSACRKRRLPDTSPAGNVEAEPLPQLVPRQSLGTRTAILWPAAQIVLVLSETVLVLAIQPIEYEYEYRYG